MTLLFLQLHQFVVLAGGNVGFKETKNWARVIRKVEKSNFSINFRVRQLKLKIAKVNLK